MKAKQTQKDLIPPDPQRCQVLKPNGNSFMTLGGKPGLVRCENKPTWIITEDAPAADGLQGSMSMCVSCRDVFDKYVKDGRAPASTFVLIKP